MNNWSSGWRKLVQWDRDRKEYIYRGHHILPLSIQEQIGMPLHLQHEYYWSEIEHIDRIEDFPHHADDCSAQELFDMIWEYWENGTWEGEVVD